MTITYNSSCFDCGIWGGEDGYPGYMVRHILWRIAVPAHEQYGHLCLSCFRRRLGRAMYPEDFIECPLNRDNMPEILEFLKGKENNDLRRSGKVSERNRNI